MDYVVSISFGLYEGYIINIWFRLGRKYWSQCSSVLKLRTLDDTWDMNRKACRIFNCRIWEFIMKSFYFLSLMCLQGQWLLLSTAISDNPYDLAENSLQGVYPCMPSEGNGLAWISVCGMRAQGPGLFQCVYGGWMTIHLHDTGALFIRHVAVRQTGRALCWSAVGALSGKVIWRDWKA